MNELNVLKRICRHLFLAVLLCAVSAATASAQVPTVTVDAKNVTIKELLQRIEANSQYTFAYIDADINPDKRVSVKAVNRSIASIIAEVLPNVNMEVKGLKIVLTAKRGGSQTRPAADAGRTVKGRVTDESGAPVIGATVILKGTTIGTATNAMGEYAIDIRQADAVLVYSLIGYNKVELALADNQTQADVTLKSEAIAMDNVVVVGYGVQNKRDVTTAIRAEEVSSATSRVAVVPGVRAALFALQKNAARLPGLVADGRDMGTVVFPEAPLKVFMTATARVRAERRYCQLLERGETADLEALTADLEERDRRDSQRATAPLKPAEDARLLDTSCMGIEEVVKKVLEWWDETKKLS